MQHALARPGGWTFHMSSFIRFSVSGALKSFIFWCRALKNFYVNATESQVNIARSVTRTGSERFTPDGTLYRSATAERNSRV